MQTEVIDRELDYAYKNFDEAPILHRQICTYASSGVLSPSAISHQLKCGVDVVYRVLAHPPVRDEIEHRRSIQLHNRFDTIDDLGELVHKGTKLLKEKLEAGLLTDAMVLKVMEFASDRHPDRALLKQTKQINEGSKGKAQGSQLVELRSRADALLPTNVAKFKSKMKQAEPVEGAVNG